MEMLNVLYSFLIFWISKIPMLAQGNIADCSDPLGLSTNQISDDSLFATSWQPGRSGPWYGRLNNESRRSWCSTVSDDNQYIQVDLGPKLRRITTVASQGSHNYDEWVTEYKLSYSLNGGKWTYYVEFNKPKIFNANNDRWTVVKHQVEPPITAVALRFHPTAWSGDMCMRVEAFGCDAFSGPLGVENASIIPDEYLTASHYHWSHHARNGRLNNIGGTWGALDRLGTFLQISIRRKLSLITAVATQGSGNTNEIAWVLSYKLSFSTWGDEWMEYSEDGQVKVFPGNNDENTVVKHYLRHNITALLIRFFPETYFTYPAMRVEVYGGKADCQEALGVENGDLPDQHFTSSSDGGPEKVPWKSRLNNDQAGWCAGENNNQQYLQVDLGRSRTVSRVATQGHPGSAFWVISYRLAYSVDGIFWRNALDESKSMILSGNTDQEAVKEISLYRHLTARFLRFRPETWSGSICMRVEVYGCEECTYPVGLERGVVSNKAFSASSWYDVDHEPWLARLYSREGEGAWCARENDGVQYLQIDLAQTYIITGVATQGKYEISEWALRFRAWVTTFSLSFADEQMTWINYIEDGNTPKIFTGNSQSNQIVRHTLLKRIVSRQLRFLPVTWSGWTCMRVEIFGCRACSFALGMEDNHIPDPSVVSTSFHGSYYPYRGRLFSATYTWMAATTDRNACLQIAVGTTDHMITAVATQGHKTYKAAVVKFQLSFSSDSLQWFDYREDGDVRIFTSAALTNTVTKHFLKRNITARFVRFWPKEWFGRRYMGVEVYGCKVCTRSIDTSKLTGNFEFPDVFTYEGSVLTAWQGSLKINDESPESSWCAKSTDPNKIQFLQLDFKLVKVVQAIAIQSHSSEDKYVETFTISSSLDGIFWKQYTEGGVLKVFQGNTHRQDVAKVDIEYNPRARYLRVYPKTWVNHPCLRLEVFAKEDCSDSLGMESGEISDEVITASSALRVNYEPWLARLHSQLGEGGWCAGKNDENQYLEIDLQLMHHVKRVATQGKYPVPECINPDAWVTSYIMQFRQDTMDWWNYTEDGNTRVFSGNSNTSVVVSHDLRDLVIARYVRFRPVNWFKRICMRVEIYGCKACFQPLGMEDFSIPGENVKSTVRDNIFNARLNYEGSQFYGGREEVVLQVNLGKLNTVTAVATQGRYRGKAFVRSYQLAFSRQEGEWFYYKEHGEVKDLPGNTMTSPDLTVLNVLHYQVIARYVRFMLKEWVKYVSIRLEVYGCETRSHPLAIASGLITNDKITSSSYLGSGNEARLNVVPDTKAWCAAPSDPSPYLQVDLGRVVVATQIAVAGKSGGGMVTTFKLSSSNDGGFWRKYTTVHGEKEFTAPVDYSQAFKFPLALEIRARVFRFLLETWTDLPCMTVELYGYDECTWPLGLTEWMIPNEAMSASSSLGTNYLPWMGRLGSKVGGGAWCAKNNDNTQYLQIDLGHVNQIHSLGIQGKEVVSRHPKMDSTWVKTFTLSYSVDGMDWTDHKQDEVSKVFIGSSNPHEVTFVSLEAAIFGRHVRIVPQSWHRHICMRVELYGCQACGDALGMENLDIPNYSLLATTPSYDASRTRLNKRDSFLLQPQVDEYVQVDLGPGGKTLTAVTIKGRFSSSNKDWITRFVLNYSRDGNEFFSYMENGVVKTFQTPSENRFFPSKHRLQHNITARYIRVLLKDWIKRPQITMELYGCEACSESNGMGNDVIPVVSSSASSSRQSHEPDKAQLLSHTGSWCASQDTRDETLQLDFGERVMLTGIATQGHHSNKEYVSKYKLDYSMDGAAWFTYTKSFGNPRNKIVELAANTDSSSVIKNEFLYEVNARFLKIVIKDWHSAICLRVQIFGYKGCNEDLGIENSKITNASINASSYLGEGYEPWNARYNRHHGKGAWCARDNVPDEFIQVQLTRVHVISRIAVQGKLKTSPGDTLEKAWVTKFVLEYSEDGLTWSEYCDGSGVVVKALSSGSPSSLLKLSINEFAGNKRHKLVNTVHARFVRVVVKEWLNHICLRMELYGCQACLEPLGLENFQIPDSSISASSYGSRTKDRVRLGYYNKDMWCAKNHDLNQFVQVDLGQRKTITAVATQGNAYVEKDSRLKEYYIQYSDDGSNWRDYTYEGQRKIFHGYKTQADTSREFLPQAIQARYIKLCVTHWYKYICTKLEIYGCEA